jgi:hypothetical protein
VHTLKECSFCRKLKPEDEFGSVNGIEACAVCMPKAVEKAFPRMDGVSYPEWVFRKLAESPTRPSDLPCDEDDGL